MRNFSDGEQSFILPATVRHQGVIIVLAAEKVSNQIYYRVLDVKPDVPDDDDNWSGLKKLDFPQQLRPAGMGLVTLDQAGEAKSAPFRALSDGRYLFTFRQSVDSTLLVDRFVFDRATGTLKPNFEARFQRSRKKDIPANWKDSLGFQDMENEPFPEPTVELELTGGLEGGKFAVLTLPTAIPNQSRWLIIVGNAKTGQFDFYSFRRSPDGLFDMGSLHETNFSLQDEQSPLTPEFGLDAILYAQQEWMTDDYGRKQKVKRSQRVMLAAAVTPGRGEGQLAVLDFAISGEGMLTRVPDEGALPPLPVLDLQDEARDHCILATLLTDIDGLELKGGLLQPTYTDWPPSLMEGSDGIVHLYFRSADDGKYMVLQYDATVSRGRIALPLIPQDKGSARLTAFQPGKAMFDAVLTIAPGTDDDHCQVKIAGEGWETEETWEDLPRRLDQFAAVLNGDTTTDQNDPRVAKGELVVYDVGRGRKFSSNRPAYLAYDLPAGIGAVRFESWMPVSQNQSQAPISIASETRQDVCKVTLRLDLEPGDEIGSAAGPAQVTEVWKDVPRDVAQFIQVLSGLVSADPDTPEVKNGKWTLYDLAANAVSNDLDADLAAGSNLFKLTERGASGALENQEVAERVFSFAGSRLFGVATEVKEVDAPLVRVADAEERRVSERGTDAKWIPEPKGYALKFEGGQSLQLASNQLPDRNFQGDLTMEGWVFIEEDATGKFRLLHHQTDRDTQFFLGLKPGGPENTYLPYAASREVGVKLEDGISGLEQGKWNHIAAAFNATNAVNLDGRGHVDAGSEEAFRMTEAVTVEAWVERAENRRREVVASRWGVEEKDQCWKLFIDADDRPGFTVRDAVHRRNVTLKSDWREVKAGSIAHIAGVFDATAREETALVLGEGRQSVRMSGTGLEVTKEKLDHTIEAWIFLEEYPKEDQYFSLLNVGREKNSLRANDHQWVVLPDGKFGPKAALVKEQFTLVPFPLKVWTHLSAIYDGSHMTVYMNGIKRFSRPLSIFHDIKDKTEPSLNVGYISPNSLSISGKKMTMHPWKGKINNLRVWNRALSESDVQKSMAASTTEAATIAGGPVGHWPFDEVDQKMAGVTKEAVDNSGRGNHGELVGGPDFVSVDKGFYRQELYVNGYLAGWTWVYFAREALRSGGINPPDMLNVIPPSNHLSLGDVISVPLQDSPDDWEQMEVTKVIPVGNELNVNPYVGVRRAVHESRQGSHDFREKLRYTRNPNLAPIDDSPDSDFKMSAMQESGVSLIIGGTAAGSERFKGKIDEVRLWNIGRFGWQIRRSWEGDSSDEGVANGETANQEKGLVAWWSFEEGGGTAALDEKGNVVARLVHPEKEILEKDRLWAPSDRNAKWTLIINGKAQDSETLDRADLGEGFSPQGFWIGRRSAGHTGPLAYRLDDVRVWGRNRTEEQIADNMYRALYGDEADLLAYWRVDEGESGRVADLTGHGHAGILTGDGTSPTRVVSDAPIGNETPEVKNAYRGASRPNKQALVSGTPSAAEYGDLQFDDEGQLFGVMKRAYVFPAIDGTIKLVTGFKIGDLELNFLGQVQTAPTLIGYIEGPPPVPSENLTVRNPDITNYEGASSVELLEANEATQVYSASRDTGFDMSVDVKAGVYTKAEGSAGLGFETKVFEAGAKFGVHAYFEHSQSWLSGTQISSTTATSLTNTLSLRGAWEEKADHDNTGEKRYLNLQVGRRYLPNNMGYALVKSATADLFALRLKRDGSLVAFQVQPNPDIPEDWNIIMFPINPKYTKNGTLDGMVGLVPDPDYPLAAEGERGSYFKPLEAYALKARIERAAKQIEGYYDRYDAGEVSGYREIGTGGDPFEENIPTDLGYDWAAKTSKRGLVNTYVWTAEGGFFAEETQFSTTKEESKGGAYHFLGKGGLYTDFKLAVGVGIFAEVDAMFGGHINTTLTQSREQKAAYGLNVEVSAEGFINRWAGDPDRKSGHYAPEPSPGKVDGYRFMTFYLSPGHEHFKKFFDRVVDPNWLYERGPFAGEYLPNARALRQAMNNDNEVWRVMHRVTFVSRVPPKMEEKPLESRPKEVRRPDNVEGNIALIEEIEAVFEDRYPGEDIGIAGLVKLGAAVEAWLEGIQKKPWGRDLVGNGSKAFEQELRQDIMTYLKNYYEMDQAAPAQEPPPASTPVPREKQGPVYYIASPTPGSQVNGLTVIRGEVSADPIEDTPKYRLEISGGSIRGWRMVAHGGRVAASDGVLGKIDARKYEAGDYRLRLVVDGGGHRPFVVPIRIKK